MGLWVRQGTFNVRSKVGSQVVFPVIAASQVGISSGGQEYLDIQHQEAFAEERFDISFQVTLYTTSKGIFNKFLFSTPK